MENLLAPSRYNTLSDAVVVFVQTVILVRETDGIDVFSESQVLSEYQDSSVVVEVAVFVQRMAENRLDLDDLERQRLVVYPELPFTSFNQHVLGIQAVDAEVLI